ncbi:MAG: flap endonuclease-1 [Candidatus Bathyarchaeota archaeon]|nr:MAG: flap endonuclease-1 [Candidatus Bathyarchaeota archaeon]
MGVNLTPIIVKRILGLEELRGKSLAVDANNMLYQFLSLIRTRDGTPLKDSRGHVTSHLVGLMFRSTRLIYTYGIDLIFVFDGKPPELKEREIMKRRRLREKAKLEWEKAVEAGDYDTAWSKAVMTSRLTKSMTEDAKRLLELLGIPYIQAPSEAEAQAAHMAKKGDVWASCTRDYDSLLFGTPRLLRYLTISGREFLPSKGVSRPLKPELIDLEKLLSHHELTHRQLIDLAILIGTDFNKGIRGIGPKTALKLIRKHSKIEELPHDVRIRVSDNFESVRRTFLEPDVIFDYNLEYGKLSEEELHHFLCEKREFSKSHVETGIERMKRFYSARKQTGLERWVDPR